MDLLKKLLENLGINEETFKNTFAIIIEAGERLKRIEEKLDRVEQQQKRIEEKLDRVEQQQKSIITCLMHMSHDNPLDYFEKQDENCELDSVKFDDDIAIDGLQTSEGNNTASFFEGSDIQSNTENGKNPNIGKS